MQNDISINRNKNYILLILGVILIAANLRAPLTSVGSLIPFIRDDLMISNALAGTLTTVPLLVFGFLSPITPKIANKISMEWTIFLALIILAIGTGLRSFFGVISLFISTTFIGVAIAVGNVLIPAFVKVRFPYKVGIMTGVYAVSMNVFAALGSGLSVPISMINGVGWQGSLLFWGILTFIAMVIWIPQLMDKEDMNIKAESPMKQKSKLWKSPLAWCITLFMGLQSLVYYTFVTWLPDLLHHYDYSSTSAGWMLFLLQFAIIPFTFIIPLAAERMKDQKILSIMTALFLMLGIIGLLVGSSSLLIISIILIGAGCGSAFSLSMMFFSMRTTSGKQAAEISGMAQSVGYFLAALGPVLFGALYDITGGWITPLIVLVFVSIVILIVGVYAGQNKIIGEKSQAISTNP